MSDFVGVAVNNICYYTVTNTVASIIDNDKSATNNPNAAKETFIMIKIAFYSTIKM